MAALTIAQLRERALINFNNEFIHDLSKARKIINSYYRLCGLSYRVCLLQNDADTCDADYTKEQEAKEEKHINRLNNYLQPYGLNIAYSGIYPSIVILDKTRPGVCIERDVYFHIG